MIHVYTGNGKGKTTAALGLAIRAAGQGLRVEVIQFMKGRSDCGEYRIIDKLFSECGESIGINHFGTGKFIKGNNVSEDDIKIAGEGMELARKIIVNKKADLIVLDEINVVMNLDIVKRDDVKKLLGECGAEMEVVLTGRGCPEEIAGMADYITEMKEVRHPNAKGVRARKGIEY